MTDSIFAKNIYDAMQLLATLGVSTVTNLEKIDRPVDVNFPASTTYLFVDNEKFVKMFPNHKEWKFDEEAMEKNGGVFLFVDYQNVRFRSYMTQRYYDNFINNCEMQ